MTTGQGRQYTKRTGYREKIELFNSLKIRNFCSCKDTIKKKKTRPQTERRYSKHVTDK